MIIGNENKPEWKSDRVDEHNNNNIITGAFLLLAGAGVLLKNMDTGIPDWVFSWETLMIGIGIFLGLRHNFKGPVWFILILIGGISLQDNLLPNLNLKQYTWPAILMVLGLYFILRPKSDIGRRNRRSYRYERWEDKKDAEVNEAVSYSSDDKLNITTILGNIKKVVVSKNFKGGEVVSFLGGSDINLSQADIQGRVRLEVTNALGGTKLIIPPTWDVQSELVAIFGGVEDKRDIRSVTIDPNKVLVLEGTCIFGGIEIRSF